MEASLPAEKRADLSESLTIDPGLIHYARAAGEPAWIGNLAVRMKGQDDPEPYILRLTPGEAVLTEPGVFFQLINEGSPRCEVLYIVSPAYVFEMGPEGTVLYDDAMALDQDWSGLRADSWRTVRPMSTAEQRAEAERRLSESKRKKSKR